MEHNQCTRRRGIANRRHSSIRRWSSSAEAAQNDERDLEKNKEAGEAESREDHDADCDPRGHVHPGRSAENAVGATVMGSHSSYSTKQRVAQR
jgi:hypothetical protein